MVKMSVKNRVLEYFRLLRFHSGAGTASILLIGSLIMGQRDPFLLIIVFFIGLLGHIYGFVLNDYVDIEVDKKSSDLKKKPLVSGTIPKEHALLIAFSACFCAYVLTIIFFPSLFSIFLLSSAAILSGIYDFLGKKIPGSDFLLAGSFFFFCLFGASTMSMHFTSLTYIVCLLFFVDFIFLNAVEGGIKDIDHDYLAGAKTLATVMGVNVKEGRLLITKKFTAFAYGLKVIYIGLIILLGFQPELNLWYSDEYIIYIIVALLVIGIFITSYKFLHLPIFDRSRMKKLYGVLNSASLSLIIIMLLPLIGPWITLLLLLLPITWYMAFNFVLYRTLLQPQV
jgi:4-hydroxybenzoate polyprenyltransferase